MNGMSHVQLLTEVARPRARAAAGFLALAAACSGLAACGGSGSNDGGTGGIRGFAAIEVGKTMLQIAANGTSAVVQLQTNPPTVCAIAYGTTRALGSIANDPSMGGTAISHHVVLLNDLRPNTTYDYRLTATDAEGRVFQTRELSTFTTTPRKSATTGRDIAQRAKVVAFSSQFNSDDYRATNAVDGNLGTEWSSAGDGNRAFITIDLGKPSVVTGVAFLSREMSNGSAITRTFAVIVDGKKRYGPFPAGNRFNPHIATVSFTGRLLRFNVVESTGGNTGAAEIEVFSRR
jgi:hypothetical protein